jgi:hypothetical protein
MARAEAPPKGSEDDIRAYKDVLSRVLENRPSGARQRLADALGKHRSFVTQITSPAYATPIPHKHIATIFAVCHFSPAERDAFMAAYRKAHRGKLDIGEPTLRTRHLTLLVPDLGDAKQNTAFDKAVTEFIGKMAGLMRPSGGDE